jgi:hypothetical protein
MDPMERILKHKFQATDKIEGYAPSQPGCLLATQGSHV